MREKVEVLVGKLHEMMSLSESCQNTCRDLSDKPDNFEQTLIRLQLLRVEIEHMRQLCHALELARVELSTIPEVEDSEAVVQAGAAAEPEPEVEHEPAPAVEPTLRDPDEEQAGGAVDSHLPNRGHETEGGGVCIHCGANLGDWSSVDCTGEAA